MNDPAGSEAEAVRSAVEALNNAIRHAANHGVCHDVALIEEETETGERVTLVRAKPYVER